MKMNKSDETNVNISFMLLYIYIIPTWPRVNRHTFLQNSQCNPDEPFR